MYLLEYIEINVKDGFCGHHEPVISVMINNKTTYSQVFNDLLDLYWSVDHIEDLDIEKYREAVWMFKGLIWEETRGNFKQEVCPNLPVVTEDSEVYEGYYIFFALTTIDED